MTFRSAESKCVLVIADSAVLLRVSTAWLNEMIACHCNIITETEIEQVIIGMLDEERWQLIVPAKVYHAMEKRGKCCRCFPNVVDIIIRTCDAYHVRFDSPASDMISYRAKLLELRNHYAGDLHERQQQGNRAA